MDEINELDRLDRERRDADARYNDALTALDRVVVSTNGRALAREDFDRAATALLQFLQQITAFVESKDRQLDAAARAHLDQVAKALEPVDELRAQVTVLQRAIQSLKRSDPGPQSATGNPQSSANDFKPDDYKYVGFEDQFRGTDEAIEERLRGYVPLFAGASDIVDLGCGRGELLAALKNAGISARGIDTNGDMVAIARERGLDATRIDALGFLNARQDASLGGLIATQVVEHLEPSYLMRLLDASARTLRPGAPIVLETINPACWLAFFSSYIRDFTHVRPVHPETLQYLLRASGFTRVTIRYSAPVPEHMKMKTIDLPAAVLASADPASSALAQMAHVLNANAVILNNLMFTHLDYAAIGYRS